MGGDCNGTRSRVCYHRASSHECLLHAARCWALPDRCRDRRRRDGACVPGHGHAARSRRGHQGPARASLERSGVAASVRARGARAFFAEPSQSLRAVRRRRAGAVRRHDSRTWSWSCSKARRSATGSRRPHRRAQGADVGGADRARTRGRAPEGRHPSRPQAGERLHHAGRAAEDPRLRAGHHERCRNGRGDAGAHRARHGHGHRALHVAGAGPRHDRSMRAPTSSPSASCCSRCSPARCRSTRARRSRR